jgi:porin
MLFIIMFLDMTIFDRMALRMNHPKQRRPSFQPPTRLTWSAFDRKGIRFLLILFPIVSRAAAQSDPTLNRHDHAPAFIGNDHSWSLRLHEVDREDRLTGNWGGARESLEQKGLSIDAVYIADFFGNFTGGINTSNAEQFRGWFQIGLELDTESAGLWTGGTFYIDMIQNHGTDITERHIGDLQSVNNSDAPNDTRLYEFWYEHRLFDDRLRLKLGKIDANTEFAASQYGAGFVHSSAGFSPTIPMPTWPDPAMGVVSVVEPADWLVLGAGVFDASGSGTRSGFETAFHAPDEVFTIAELGIRTNLDLFNQRNLPGTYRVGGWYHSGTFDEFFNDLGGRLPARSHRGNAGVYVVIDQRIFDEHPDIEEDNQGLGAFFQFAWAPSDYNEITQHYGLGVEYTGPFEGRDHDVFGLGMHHVTLSGEVQSLEGRHSETAIELFYQYQLAPAVIIKPDIQYIANPGGNGQDAIVGGIRLEIAF